MRLIAPRDRTTANVAAQMAGDANKPNQEPSLKTELAGRSGANLSLIERPGTNSPLGP